MQRARMELKGKNMDTWTYLELVGGDGLALDGGSSGGLGLGSKGSGDHLEHSHDEHEQEGDQGEDRTWSIVPIGVDGVLQLGIANVGEETESNCTEDHRCQRQGNISTTQRRRGSEGSAGTEQGDNEREDKCHNQKGKSAVAILVASIAEILGAVSVD